MLLKETSVGVVLYPGVYKFTGIYPKSITEEKNTANKNLSDENIIHTK